jgi:hypothetical protein
MKLDGVIPGHGPIVAIIPEHPERPRGLGRHVCHDPRSRAYGVGVDEQVSPGHIFHQRHIPILDQGQLGSCTGNAGTGMLGSGPFYTGGVAALGLNELYAVGLYSEASHLDGIPGYYPPTDGGASGLGVAKALRRRGLIDRYEHAFSIKGMLAALKRAPVIVGTVWLSGMSDPDSQGFAHLAGSVQGGHEYLCREYEPAPRLSDGVFTFDNSWSSSWGDGGRFRIRVGDFAYLLGQQGDVTAPVPRS